MIKNLLKTKNLNRSALKQIKGGIIDPQNNCNFLCGPAGGVKSNHPGRGDVCNADGSLCCYCY